MIFGKIAEIAVNSKCDLVVPIFVSANIKTICSINTDFNKISKIMKFWTWLLYYILGPIIIQWKKTHTYKYWANVVYQLKKSNIFLFIHTFIITNSSGTTLVITFTWPSLQIKNFHLLLCYSCIVNTWNFRI